MKIAIIGTGISGLAAARALYQKHDITVYEKANYVGGHGRTLEVATPQNTVAVDTGFIVFNPRNYPRLTTLFKQLDVPVSRSAMSFGVSIDNGWLEYGTPALANLFAQKRNIFRTRYYGMLRDILYFQRHARAFVQANPQAVMEECLAGLGMGDWFKRYYLLAMGGAIWSTPPARMLRFPARTMVRFFENHGLLALRDRPKWHTVRGGSREYIARLSAPFRDSIRVNCGVCKVQRLASGVFVTDRHGGYERYDHAVLACHSDQALRLIEAPTPAEQSVLENICYQRNRALLHSDTRFMPRKKQAWASWVYLCQRREDREPAVSLSYWMNNLQPLGTDYPLFVTLNPAFEPDPALVHDEHVFEHPLFDQNAIAAQERLDEIQGQDRLWFCGAWQGYGFHEDGLNSAIAMADKFTATSENAFRDASANAVEAAATTL